jgi:glutaredoxin-related protein
VEPDCASVLAVLKRMNIDLARFFVNIKNCSLAWTYLEVQDSRRGFEKASSCCKEEKLRGGLQGWA